VYLFLKVIYKRCLTPTVDKVFFEKFRRQAPVKSAIAKMIKKFRETGSLLDKNRNRQKSGLTPGILQDIQMAISFPTLTVNTG
jgi:hypothetical protein